MQTKTPNQRYQDALKQGFAPDAVQAQAIQYLQKLYDELTREKGFFEKNFNLFKPDSIKGLYMWGGVGRGKTWLMDLFFDSLPFADKMRMHFHHFMKHVQSELIARQGQQDPLEKVADGIAARARVICFDEFFVNNVADAMILGDLFTMLFAKGVVLVATSNIAPDGLYKDGIHRDRFLGAIAAVKAHTVVMNIDAGTDYRLRLLEQAHLYAHPLNNQTKQWLDERFVTLTQNAPISRDDITINGRNLAIIGRAGLVLYADFRALCMQPRAPRDFIELAERFDTLLIDGVPFLNDVLADPTLRFIYLIDELYDRRVKVLIRAEQPILELYDGSKLAFEIERTRSRLLEMQSKDYLGQSHKVEQGA